MKPQYACAQNGKAKITISKKEGKYTSTLKGKELKILKTPEKYLLKIVNVYAPHNEINKNPEITINFYNNLKNLLNQINNKSSIVLLAGDFNEETGGKTDVDRCLGNFSGGRRNQNGQHDLVITNIFQTQREKINNVGTNSYCTR